MSQHKRRGFVYHDRVNCSNYCTQNGCQCVCHLPPKPTESDEPHSESTTTAPKDEVDELIDWAEKDARVEQLESIVRSVFDPTKFYLQHTWQDGVGGCPWYDTGNESDCTCGLFDLIRRSRELQEKKA